MPKGFKRKRSRKGMFRKGGRKQGKFRYGPVGGVRAGRFGTTQNVDPSPQIGPDRQFMCVSKTYVGQLQSSAAGAFGVYNLKANSCFNPLGSITTGQPIGFSNFCGTAGQYRAYIVHAFRIEVQSVVSNINGVMGVSFRPASMSVPSSMAQVAGLARSKVVQMLPEQLKRISIYATVGQIYGQTDATVAMADSFSALYNTDPSSEIFCDLSFQENSATTQITISCVVKMTQYVEFFGRNTLA